MLRYDRVVNGVVTNSWYDSMGNASYTEPGWGDPKLYTVVTTDMATVYAAKAAAAKLLATDKTTLLALTSTTLATQATSIDAILKLVKQLG